MKPKRRIFRTNNISSTILLFVLSIVNNYVHAQIQMGPSIIGEAANDQCGNSVCMPDNNTIAVGAWRNDGFGNSAGHARVFDYNGTSWIQRGADLNGVDAGDWYGYYVDMPNDSTIAVSAPYGDNGAITLAGYVKIFTWNGTAWIQKGTTLYGTAVNDYFGWMVKMVDADHFIASTVYANNNGPNSGLVQVFDWDGSNWVQRGTDILGMAPDDRFGWSVAMPTLNTIAASANFNDGSQNNAGLVQVFDWDGSAWVQRGTNIYGEADGDQLGSFIYMPNENTIAASAVYNDGSGADAGHTRIFAWNGDDWVQKGSDIDGEGVNDQSGRCIWMPNQDWIAIGSIKNDGNGVNSGSVRIYKFDGTSWVQVVNDMDGEAADDNYGYSVCMPDTNTIAIGAILNDANGADAGEVKVFELTTITKNSSQHYENGISLFPNPVKDVLTMAGVGIHAEVTIFDISGKQVYSEKTNSVNSSISISHLENGVYFLSVMESNTIRTAKLILSK